MRETIVDNYIWFVSYFFISLWWCSKLSPCLGGQLYNIKQVGVYSVSFIPKRYTTKLRRRFLISYFFVSYFLCTLAELIFPKRGDCKGCCLWDSWSVYSNLPLYIKLSPKTKGKFRAPSQRYKRIWYKPNIVMNNCFPYE